MQGGRGGRGNIWTAPRRRLEARQCWANQRRTNAPELSRAAVSSDMHNARSVSVPLASRFSLFSLSISLSFQSPRSFTDNAAHTELLVLLSSAQLSSVWAGSIKIPTIREHFTCLSNSQQRSQRPQQEEAGGRRGRKERESSRRGAEASGVDKRCNKLIVQHSSDAQAEAAARQAALCLLLYPVAKHKGYA